MTLMQAVFAYLEARRPELADATRRKDREVLMDLALAVGDHLTPSKALTTQRISRWRGAHDWAPATDRLSLCRVRLFCRWLVDNGHLKRDPTRTLKAPVQPDSVPRARPHDDVSALLRNVPDERAKLIVLLMVQEGLRCGECCAILTGDLDHAQRSLLVRGKRKRERVVPVSDETWQALEDWITVRGLWAGPLICAYTGQGNLTRRALSPRTLSHCVSNWMKEAGIKQGAWDGVSAHALRHTAATDMLRNGAHLLDVQAALGHSQIGTTRRYLPLVVNNLRDAMGGRSYGDDAGEGEGS